MEERSQHLRLAASQFQWLSDHARSCGYSSPEDYLRELIRREQALYGQHAAPEGRARENAAAELSRVMKRIAENFRDVPEDDLDAEIERACADVRHAR